jgi:hypothetical protein
MFALCKLHNFCLNERENRLVAVPSRLDTDPMTWLDSDESEDAVPGHLLAGGEHFDDVQEGRRGAGMYVWGREEAFNVERSSPRDGLASQIREYGWKRKVRGSKKRTRNDQNSEPMTTNRKKNDLNSERFIIII